MRKPRVRVTDWAPRPSQGCSQGCGSLTLVAEKAPPALLAGALPRLLAGAVQTARVADALVTVPALPAHSAPEEKPGRSQGDADTPRSRAHASHSREAVFLLAVAVPRVLSGTPKPLGSHRGGDCWGGRQPAFLGAPCVILMHPA